MIRIWLRLYEDYPPSEQELYQALKVLADVVRKETPDYTGVDRGYLWAVWRVAIDCADIEAEVSVRCADDPERDEAALEQERRRAAGRLARDARHIARRLIREPRRALAL